jgi:hypothetical protein
MGVAVKFPGTDGFVVSGVVAAPEWQFCDPASVNVFPASGTNCQV